MPTLGIDIGGANLKFADSKGRAKSTVFPMWKRSGELADALLQGSSNFTDIHCLAITMTGEMADCFANRSEGVRWIADAVARAFPSHPASFYCVDGNWYSYDQVIDDPISVAASNWRALAQYVANQIDTPSILIDIGSTTTDLIALESGRVLTTSRTDLDRLLSHELVYTGLERSNIAGLLHSIEVKGNTFPIVNELFATTLDAHLVLGNIEPSQSCEDTADGSARTVSCARQRLARCLGADVNWLEPGFIEHVAQHVLQAQLRLIAAAIQTRLQACTSLNAQAIVSGHGGVLAHAALAMANWNGKSIDLTQLLGSDLSRAACAYAVAVLNDQERSV